MSVPVTLDRDTPPSRTSATRPRRRDDIEGLRAVAILLVLLYHAGVPLVPGGFIGVDVFFVISGYLITGLLLREAATTGGVSVPRFWARRIKRLLPAGVTVLVATLLGTWLFLPVTSWRLVAGDVGAASVSMVNWRFAERTVDYLAKDVSPSPVTHFWSLAVESQFYLVWPLVLWLLVRVWRNDTAKFRLAAAITFTGLTIASLALAVERSTQGDPTAFFTTHTRLWELGIGALTALAAVRLARLTRRWSLALSASGLVGIVAAAVLIGPTTDWPGLATLLPTVSTVMLIAGGSPSSENAVTRALSVRPFVLVGALSYSLYLWHWPILTIASARLDVTHWGQGLGLVVLSAVPAYASYRWIEGPARSLPVLNRARVSLLLGALLTVATAACAALLWLGAASGKADDGDHPGAAALRDGTAAPFDRDAGFAPSVQDATDDLPDVYADGCHVSQTEAEALRCTYGRADATFVVALVGDSHAAQWQPALRSLAEDQGWRLDSYTKSGCPVTTALLWNSSADTPYTTCTEWNRNVVTSLGASPPDLVVTSQGGDYRISDPTGPVARPAADEALTDGMAARWSEISSFAPVAVLLDTPMPGIRVPECLAVDDADGADCSVELSSSAQRSASGLQRAAAASTQPDLMIDMTEYVCPGSTCPPVIGSVLVWRDSNHMTATYSKTLGPYLGEALAAFPGFGRSGDHGAQPPR